MSRNLIIYIICLSISTSMISVSLAQEEQPEAMTLSERLAALRDKFRRDDSPTTKKSSPTRKTYGSTLKSRPSNASATINSKRKSILSGMNPSALLPSNVFGRKEDSASTSQHPLPYGPETTARANTSTKSNKKTTTASSKQQTTRKSPPTVRANELEAALADLVPVQQKPTAKPATESIENIAETLQAPIATGPATVTKSPIIPSVPAVSSNLPPTPTPNDGFDLHDALLGKAPEAEAIADDNDATAIVTDDDALATDDETIGNFPPTDITTQPEQPSIVATQPKVDATPAIVSPVPEAAADLPQPEFALPSPVEQESQPSFVSTPEASDPVASVPQPQVQNNDFVNQEPSQDPFAAAAVEAFSSSPEKPSQQQSIASQQQKPAAEKKPISDDVLFSYQQPVIVSHVEGPRQIVVGREATYQIILENTSKTKANSLSSSIRIPSWAEVVDAMSTSGVVEQSSTDGNAGILEWKLNELAAHTAATLQLRLIPRSGQPLQLGVHWSQAPVGSEATVEVQEPKLLVEVSGPEEVLFGKPQRYRLSLSNPGTGLAEQVAIKLIPPGGDPENATEQVIGSLQAGEVRDLDLELTAREAGELTIQASATAEGGLSADSIKNVLCLKPELQVDWRGPETKYAGTVAAYYFRVRNPGTANTEPVTVRVKIPNGSQFVAASDGHHHDNNSNEVIWQLTGIAPGQEQFMQVRCKVDQPGANTFDITAQTSTGDLSDSKVIQTNVVALADLKLDVSDPQGPIALGEPVLYEIRVRNRGTTAAEGVSIVGLFSAGIEPTSVEGAQYSIRDGRVSFNPIQNLPAGQEVVLKIRAVANQAGTHIFRAQVDCQDLDIKLAAEETTRFFKDEFRWEDGQTPYSAERNDSVTR